jgi:hypothetical protein
VVATVWYYLFFHWPDGGVWSNLVASFIWATPTIIISWRKLRRMHLHLHERLDRIEQTHSDDTDNMHALIHESHEKLDRLLGRSDG